MFGLDYKDSSINIYQEYQQFKSLPYISSLLEKGKPIEYGAKCIYEGGVYSMPSPVFPGGVLMGESARLVDTFKIKGAHLAMYSGLLAANSIVNALEANREAPAEQLNSYEEDLYQSFIYKEMYRGKFVRYLYKLNYVLAACYTVCIEGIERKA